MGQMVVFHLTVKELFRKANSSSTFPIDLKMCIYQNEYSCQVLKVLLNLCFSNFYFDLE